MAYWKQERAKERMLLFLVVGALPDGGAVDLLHENGLLLAALALRRSAWHSPGSVGVAGPPLLYTSP